jgi:hypothetical protein
VAKSAITEIQTETAEAEKEKEKEKENEVEEEETNEEKDRLRKAAFAKLENASQDSILGQVCLSSLIMFFFICLIPRCS